MTKPIIRNEMSLTCPPDDISSFLLLCESDDSLPNRIKNSLKSIVMDFRAVLPSVTQGVNRESTCRKTKGY